MTLVDAPVTPAAPPPTRSSGGRTLAWVGGTLGLLLILWAALDVVGLVARQEAVAQSTHAAAAVVELVADGDVTVRTSTASDVAVERTGRWAFVAPEFRTETAGDTLVVEYTCPWRYLWSCEADLDVTLPAGTQLVVRTSDGDVRASGSLGGAELRTSNGRVEASDVTGDLQVRSSNGDVVVGDVTGAVTAETSNGRIEVTGAGSLEAHTSNGDVDVLDVAGAVDVESSNGRIDIADARSDISAVTSNGDVTVRGTGEPVALDIDTSNGRQEVAGATDPAASIRVVIRSSNGSVAYLGPRGSDES
ncbi:DUF4097 family beta strand repeat protein [Cellulomonas sp. DKR-3]|uniref:DUF4097 family beta strand repeat protein n=1 Tax=Cellulomonas fulva TaxID=2835530 RepID=A0ABS5TXV0_9CELL|nr:DUF4097 family beta strand repeat-containing protein [Cellulomonas fulva]MBT0993935.1 DUF4097 family beta strand repeat protein [Cellulomonas fulva]